MVKLLENVACMSLKTAGLVIGGVCLVGDLIGLIISAWIIIYADELADYQFPISHSLEDDELIHSMFAIFGSIYLGVVVISIVVSVLLIFGTLKKRHLMILPWLIFQGIGLALNAMTLLIAVFEIFEDPIANSFNFSISLLFFVLYYYIYLGIYSLYKQIQNNRDSGHEMFDSVKASWQHNTASQSVYGKV